MKIRASSAAKTPSKAPPLRKTTGPEGLTVAFHAAREEDRRRLQGKSVTDSRINSVIKKVAPAVRAAANRRSIPLHDQADIEQEALREVVQKKLRKKDPTGNTKGAEIAGFVYRVAANKSVDYWRKRRSTLLLNSLCLDEELAEIDPNLRVAYQDSAAATQLALVKAAYTKFIGTRSKFNALTIKCFELTAFEGRKPAAVADELGIPASQVSVNKLRVLKTLAGLVAIELAEEARQTNPSGAARRSSSLAL